MIEECITWLKQYNVIFTGSYVLKLLKYLPESREVNDIDLVFRSEEDFKVFIASSGSTILPLDQETYQEHFWKVINPLFCGITIDCFANPAVDTIDFVTSFSLTEPSFECQSPRQLLQQKLGILVDRLANKEATYDKHWQDLLTIFGDKYEQN